MYARALAAGVSVMQVRAVQRLAGVADIVRTSTRRGHKSRDVLLLCGIAHLIEELPDSEGKQAAARIFHSLVIRQPEIRIHVRRILAKIQQSLSAMRWILLIHIGKMVWFIRAAADRLAVGPDPVRNIGQRNEAAGSALLDQRTRKNGIVRVRNIELVRLHQASELAFHAVARE